MRKVLAEQPKRSFKKPSGLSNVKICTESGDLATEFCPKTLSALVLSEHRPRPCELHTEPIEVELPKLVGLPKEDALAKLETLKLKAKVVEKQVSGVASGIVAQQSSGTGNARQGRIRSSHWSFPPERRPTRRQRRRSPSRTLRRRASPPPSMEAARSITTRSQRTTGSLATVRPGRASHRDTHVGYFWDVRGDPVGDRQCGPAGLQHQSGGSEVTSGLSRRS